MTLQEQAEECVKDEYCRDCTGGPECCYIKWGTPNDCEGFRTEVELVLKDWATEEVGREVKNGH